MRPTTVLLAASLMAGAAPALAAEAKIAWYDPTCRYFVAQLPEGSEGFGLFEWKEGPEPKVDDVLEGDVLGGPELKVVNKTNGETLDVVHWGDAKKMETLVKYSPDWCKSKRKKR